MNNNSNEENAEYVCEKCVTEALNYDTNSFDALIQISNLRILRKRDDEAVSYMDRLYNSIMTLVELGDESSLPTQEILLNLSKNYSELGLYLKAIKILDVCVKINEDDLECWYLLAFNHYTIKNFKHSMRCLKNFSKVSGKTSYKSDEVLDLEDAAKELFQTLERIKSDSVDGELKNNHLEESEELDNEEKITDNSNSDMNID